MPPEVFLPRLRGEIMSRGGYRPGAGRKSDGSAPKKKISVSISLEAAEALKDLEVVLVAKNRSQVVEYLLTEAWIQYEAMDSDQRPKLS